MAELSYRDVQRAVQDSLRNLQDTVQRLSTNMGSVSTTRADHIAYIENTIRELQRTTQLMQQNLNTMRINSGADPRIAQLTRDMYDLKIRFSAIERFILQAGVLLQEKAEEDRQDREFRQG